MIRDTCAFLTKNNRRVIYDVEHFFTGYRYDRDYALKTLTAAIEGEADVLTLCETTGGCLIDECKKAVADVCTHFGRRRLDDFRIFFEQSKMELKKVVWPSRQETLGISSAVLLFVVVLAIFLGTIDYVLTKIIASILS